MTRIISAVLLSALLASTAAFAYDDDEAPAPRSTVHRSHVKHETSRDEDFLGFQFGPSIGTVTQSVAAGGTVNPTNTRTRPMFGAYYEHKFIPYFSLRAGLDYDQRGWSSSNNQAGAALRTVDVAANYIELPILAKGQYSFGVVTPFVMTGPFAGLAVGSGQVISANGVDNPQDISNLINSFEFGWDFGTGAAFQVASHIQLEAGMRYSLGVTNLLANAAAGTGDKLNSLEFLVGMTVGL